MMPVRLEPAALWSRVKHSTTEPLRSHYPCLWTGQGHFDHNHKTRREVLAVTRIEYALNYIYLSGLENSTRPLVFTSALGCRASENFDISNEN